MILGITGKSGAGKSAAAGFFAQRNWEVLEADEMAHQLYRPYQRVWKEVVQRFGEGILKKNDVIDRQKLRPLLFSDSDDSKKALKDMNAIVHPELIRTLKESLYFLRKKNRNVVLVAALWEELRLFELCDKVLLIQARDDLAYHRLHKRDGLESSAFEVIHSTQSEPPTPDFTVINEGDFQSLYKQLNVIVNQL